MALTDPSGLVRLVLASTLQRLPVQRRVELAQALLSRVEDAADHNLPVTVRRQQTDAGTSRIT